jgi:CBS domain-containing protein
MPFVIYEQGVRIQTPANQIFPPATVSPVQPVQGSRKVTERDLEIEGRRFSAEALDRGAGKGHAADHFAAGGGGKDGYKEGGYERKRVLFAKEVMSRDLVTLLPEAPLSEAFSHFQQHTFRHLPVVNADGRLEGMLSDRDMWRWLAVHKDVGEAQTHRVRDLMQSRVISATEKTEIRLLAGAMAENKIGALPVVASDGLLLGMVTSSDILRVMVSQAPLELWV